MVPGRDEVFGDVMYHGGSAFADYVCVPETVPIVHKPATVSFRRSVHPSGGGAHRLSAATVGRLLSTGGRKIGMLMVRPNKRDLFRVADMVAAGTLRTTVERTYPLDGVPEALDHLGEGRALGKLVIGIG